jgi:hypothetical protein
MPIVINEFEVTPQTPVSETKAATRNADGKGGKKQELTDHEIAKMIERRTERAERVAAH